MARIWGIAISLARVPSGRARAARARLAFDLMTWRKPRGHAAAPAPPARARPHAAPATASHRLQAASEGGTAARRRAAHPPSQTARRSLDYCTQSVLQVGGCGALPTTTTHQNQTPNARTTADVTTAAAPAGQEGAPCTPSNGTVRRSSSVGDCSGGPRAARRSLVALCASREFGRWASGRPHHPQQISRS